MFLFFYTYPERKENNMKDYITNTIILKNGDQVEIVEPASLPLSQKLMYQIENAEYKVIINYKGTKTIIPVENILFATSSPLTITHEELIDEI